MATRDTPQEPARNPGSIVLSWFSVVLLIEKTANNANPCQRAKAVPAMTPRTPGSPSVMGSRGAWVAVRTHGERLLSMGDKA